MKAIAKAIRGRLARLALEVLKTTGRKAQIQLHHRSVYQTLSVCPIRFG